VFLKITNKKNFEKSYGTVPEIIAARTKNKTVGGKSQVVDFQNDITKESSMPKLIQDLPSV